MDKNLNFSGNEAVSNRSDFFGPKYNLRQSADRVFRVQITSLDATPVYDRARQVINFCREAGMAPPLVFKDDLRADLFYRIENPPDDFVGVKETAIALLSLFFADGAAEVTGDTDQVEMEGRLYDGTLGDSTITALDRIAAYYPRQIEDPHECNNYDPKSFRIANFLKIHGMQAETEQRGDVTIYRLQKNPFTRAETTGSAIYERVTAGGQAIGFHCTDPGYTNKTWSDLRKKVAPDPEEKAYQTERQKALQPLIAKALDPEGPIWQDVAEIEEEPEKRVMSTGLQTLDDLMRGGFRAGEFTIITGLPASGKSTWLSQLIIHAAEFGTKTAIFSGELTASRFQAWMLQQLAGTHCVKTPTGKWSIPEDIKGKIKEWLKGRVYLYNNERGMTAERIIQTAETAITSYGLGLLVLDNFMMMDTGISRAEDTIQAQTRVATALSAIAKKYDIHVILVAHPRKQTGFLTAYDVAGTSNLYNLSDNLLAVHRVNEDFITNVQKSYAIEDDDDLFTCDNAIQVLKNREAGVQGDFVGLLYEGQSRTFVDAQKPQKLMRAWEISKPAKTEPEAQS